MATPVFTAHQISKAFGPVHALSEVTVALYPGEVHAVLGENGAGKSTLMNILSGFLRPDAGELRLHDHPVQFSSSAAARHRGVEMVHQHFMLVPEFRVEENLALGQLDRLTTSLNVETRAAQAVRIAQDLGWQVDPRARTGDLSVGQQQRIEILKALASDAEILILDEPTAVLGPDEVEDLFRVIRALAQRGKSIVLIAHKLREVLAIADRVTVLRRGKWVAEAMADDVNATQLAEWMVGEVPPLHEPSRAVTTEPRLVVQDLTVRGDRGETSVQSVSFTLHCGEILGFGGVDGNGQVELAEALMGLRPVASGELTWPGRTTLPRRAYIPQDRHEDGLALHMSILDNLLIGGQADPALAWGPFLRPWRIQAWAQRLVEQFQIRIGKISDPVSSLSGGNQQKVVVSRALNLTPDVLVVVNPTRGLDLRAAYTVHECLRASAEAGVAIALFSTDRDELAELAHRSLFMAGGEFQEDLNSALTGGVA